MFFIQKPKKPRKKQNNQKKQKKQSWATLQPDWEHRPKSCPGLVFLVFLVILVFPSFFLVFLWKTLVLLSLFWFVYGKHLFCLVFFWFVYGKHWFCLVFFGFCLKNIGFARFLKYINSIWCVNVYKFRNSFRNTWISWFFCFGDPSGRDIGFATENCRNIFYWDQALLWPWRGPSTIFQFFDPKSTDFSYFCKVRV